MLKKAIIRLVYKVRLDVDATGAITPVLLRLDPHGEVHTVEQVERVDDRISEVWFTVLTTTGERLTLRLVREGLRLELHTVETDRPERWENWSERAQAGSPA